MSLTQTWKKAEKIRYLKLHWKNFFKGISPSLKAQHVKVCQKDFSHGAGPGQRFNWLSPKGALAELQGFPENGSLLKSALS